MDNQKIRILGVRIVIAIWLVLTLAAWFGPDGDFSMAERRPLAQMPALTVEAVMDGSFMTKFEDYTLDQFPLRDDFREVKSLTHYYLLGQSDNNGIYLANGAAVKQEYPLNPASVDRAAERFTNVYNMYLRDSNAKVYLAVVPDKGYYLAGGSGQLAMDYEAMFTMLENRMPWATYIDLTATLTADSYYRTDTHWRQEMLIDTAAVICDAMGVAAAPGSAYQTHTLDNPFYGVYYGQAALPMQPDTMCLLESELLSSCTTYLGDWDMQANEAVFVKLYDGVYDMEKLQSADLYEIYLSGSESLLRIENPNAATDRELIVFRDSFGSSVIPLLLQDYAVVTVVDIRYIQPMVLQYYDINWDADVLFLYSTLVLNNSETIK